MAWFSRKICSRSLTERSAGSMGAAISAFILSVHPTVGDAARVGALADLAGVRGEGRANFGPLWVFPTCRTGDFPLRDAEARRRGETRGEHVRVSFRDRKSTRLNSSH